MVQLMSNGSERAGDRGTDRLTSWNSGCSCCYDWQFDLRPCMSTPTLTTCERPELAQCFRVLYPSKPSQLLAFHEPTVMRRHSCAKGGGECAVVPRVRSLFRFYSDPKKTTPQPRFHHNRRRWRAVIPSRGTLPWCLFLCVSAARLSSLTVPSMLEHQCSPWSRFFAVLESVVKLRRSP
jgi:hypothetical protein